MRRIAMLAVPAVLLFPTSGLHAQIDIGAQATYDTQGLSDAAFGLGARVDVGVPVGALPGLEVQGTFDWFFDDLADYWGIAGNVIWNVDALSPDVSPYVGAGLLHLEASDVDFEDNAAQVLAGLEFGLAGVVSPFVELKYQFKRRDDALVVSAGISF